MYNDVVQNLIKACQWDTTNFLVISDNVFDPLIYYSHIVPLIISLTIGFFVLYKNPKMLLPRILFVMTTLFSFWVFFDLILWATDKPDLTIFFWSIINLIEPFIYASCLYFFQVFIANKDTSLKNKIIILIPLLPLFVFAFTKFNLLGYDLSACDREAVEGPLTHYSYIVEIFYTLWILILGMESFRKSKDSIFRHKIILMTVGVILFLLTFSFGNIIGSITDDWRVPQWGLFGMPIFIIFLSYLIIKYKTLDIRLVATQALAVMISILVGSQFFFMKNPVNIYLNILTFAISVVGGILLVKTVNKEILQREEIEQLADNLRITNSNLFTANDRLKELDKQKTEFVSFASHQLRSPLTAMKGYSSLILEGDYGDITPDLRDAVQKIHESTNTLTSVVNDYLNISRIELGTMKYDFKVLDLKEVVKEVIGEQQPNIDKAGIKFNLEVDARSKYLTKIDIDKFKQVLLNILDNSIKYTPTGSITAFVKKDTEKNTVTFAVKDTGIGMAEGVIPKLFAKFSRAENANKVNIRGTGLGLYVAKEIVKAHGGRIWAESEGEGKGSQFYVELPAEK
jgi:signal transduction histidine kinase